MNTALYTYSYRLKPGLGQADLNLARQVLDEHTGAFMRLPQVQDPTEVVSHDLFYELVPQERRNPLAEW